MGFDEGQIVLDSPNGSYYSGQTIYGKLVFETDKPMTFRGIYMGFKGYCKVDWTTTYNRRSRATGRTRVCYIYHKAEEEYVHMKTYLIGGETGECTLQPGSYEFPFQCALPSNCPSSFEASHGHVRYEIKVVVDRAFKLDEEKIATVRVWVPVNLNAEPYCKEQMQFVFNDSYCCFCMGYGSTATVIKLPLSGYCPGQVIPIEIGCTNTGRVKIDQIKFSIIKTTTLRVKEPPATTSEDETVAGIMKGPVPARSTRNWVEELPLPAMDVYNLDTCQFIDVDYKFKVEVCPAGCHRNSDDCRRIIIGTIPLVGFQDNIQNPLHDQMPQQFMPIVKQPLPSTPMNSPYPSSNPYPDLTSVPKNQYPNTPYPNESYENPPATNPAFSTTNSPYPTNPPPYSIDTPNPTNTNPFPTFNPGANQPYITEKTPYPTTNPNFPNPEQNLKFPSSNQPSGGPGAMPATNPVSPQAPGNPYGTASAPADVPDGGKQ